MDTETAAPQTEVPIKVTEPEDHTAPPSLAEPASGAVAEMTGALSTEEPVVPKIAEPTGTHSISGIALPNLTISTEAPAANGVAEAAPDAPKEPEEPAAEANSAPAAPAPASADTEVKEADETEHAQVETNGALVEKKPSSSKRKSSGIPEHKGKKLNKKKSMPKLTHLDAKPGELYTARLKSYPPWPSIICDEEMLPEILINTRPVTTKRADGTYNEAYADGGKREHERTFPIMFLYTNEL